MKKSKLVYMFISLVVISLLIFFFITIKSKHNDKIIAINKENNNVTKIETEKTLVYEINDTTNKLDYSWSFEKNKNDRVKNISSEIDLGLKLLKGDELYDIDTLEKIKDKLVISFNYHGILPNSTTAKIKVNVGDKFNSNKKLYLYYIDEENNQIEYISDDVKINNNYAEFEITHCSKYFLTASIVQEAVNNPKNINIIIITMVAIIIALIASTLFQNKK